ncbi:HU family DNA-binding protein [Aequorivita echinoideorum]|uniref:DNA-binding protein n=1 Tax=Aequorivita echinoideorum TaxID=1549647 RepID=A0ABS5S5G4_9FLAO|nr:HU family DNA-binding protein [Aequorivita echinoideorum]MBT0608443.1 DNA-binding protein [Aequorivita echinoideorum]
MAIKYRVTKRKDTINNETDCKYIMQAISKGEVNLRRLSWEISNMSTHTEGDVYGVLIMLVKQMRDHLEQGETVVLDDMGRFKIGFQCQPETMPEKLSKKSIKKFSVNYMPSKELKHWLKTGLEVEKEK